MIGHLIKKYHVAILNDDEKVIPKVTSLLKSLYNNKVVIKIFYNAKDMLEAINVSKVKNNPFDAAVLGKDEYVKKFMLHTYNPNLDIITYDRNGSLKNDRNKLV